MSVKDMENQPMIAFVGGGNMAEAMLGGLYNSGYPKDHLGFSEPFNERRSYMTEKYPNVKSFSDSKQVVEGAQIIFFAVKPQIMPAVMGELKEKLKENPHALLISVAGGVTTDNIRRWLNASSNVSLIRMMPNTPMLIGEGAVGLFATDTVDAKQRELTETILRTVAKQLVWVKDESLLDTITAVSGSGPAYYFLIMEAMQNAGIEGGLSPEDAKALTLQTCLGAVQMALDSGDDLATLRDKVTSPNGTTAAAVNALENGGLRNIIAKAIEAATNRSRELSKDLS